MQNEYLVHYGVLGMKWGRRKSKPSSGSKKTSTKKTSTKKTSTKKTSTKKSTSSKKKSIKQKVQEAISKVDKEKVKNIAKTSAIIAGKIAAVSLLGYAGGMAVSEISRLKLENAQLSSSVDQWKRLEDLSSNRFYEVLRKNIRLKASNDELKRLADNLDKIDDLDKIDVYKYKFNKLKKYIDVENFKLQDIPIINETVKLKKK